MIKSENDPKFNTPQYFPAVKEASLASGIPVSSIRFTRSTMSPLTRKTAWNVLTPLISEDRTQKSMINDESDVAEMSSTFYKAAQSTGIGYDALEHASISEKSTITEREPQVLINTH